MAIRHDYTLICEMARQEIGGKFLVIGLFPNGIGAPQLPLALPLLTFFSALHLEAAGAYRFTGRLSRLEGGTAPLAQAQGMLQAAGAGPVMLPIPIQNLRFMAFGEYSWSLEFEGEREPFVTLFQVAHVNPFQPPFVPGGVPRL